MSLPFATERNTHDHGDFIKQNFSMSAHIQDVSLGRFGNFTSAQMGPFLTRETRE